VNLAEAKRKVLMILDEYSSNGALSLDADIEIKMNGFFDMACQDVSRIKGIVRRFVVPLVDDGFDYVEYAMPVDFDRLIRVWADLQPEARGRWLGKSLILPGSERRKIEVEYLAHPPRIMEDTPDDYELELEEDAQQCLVLYVAAQQLASDLVVDNSRLWQQYREALSRLSPSYEGGGLEVVSVGGFDQVW
jgi:hypothetical protein